MAQLRRRRNAGPGFPRLPGKSHHPPAIQKIIKKKSKPKPVSLIQLKVCSEEVGSLARKSTWGFISAEMPEEGRGKMLLPPTPPPRGMRRRGFQSQNQRERAASSQAAGRPRGKKPFFGLK